MSASDGKLPMGWIAAAAAAAAIAAAFVWFGTPPLPGSVAPSAAWIVRLAAIIAIAGVGFIVIGGHGVRIASHGGVASTDNTDAFTRGAGFVLAGLLACAAALWLSWPQVGGPGLAGLVESHAFQNSFEIVLIALVVIVIGACDWFARAWVTAGDDAARAVREEAVDLFAMTLACSLGVLTLVAIGSSVFSARLVQVDFARAAAELETRLSINRAIEAADQDARLAAEMTWADDEFVAAGRIWYVREDERIAAVLSGDHDGAAIAETLRDAARTKSDNLIDDMHRLRRERLCLRGALAEDVHARKVSPEGGESRASSSSEDGCQYTRYEDEDLAPAAQLMASVTPIRRSWMSTQLALRAPVVLSIELVLIMGALGALLRAATPYLLAFVQRLDDAQIARLQAQKAKGQKYLMLTLGLHVVFGMSTAFIFFLLLKTGISTVELQAPGTSAADTDINPFTASVLGLLGGYASLNVVEWIGVIAGDLTQKRRDDGDGGPPGGPSNPDDGAQAQGAAQNHGADAQTQHGGAQGQGGAPVPDDAAKG